MGKRSMIYSLQKGLLFAMQTTSTNKTGATTKKSTPTPNGVSQKNGLTTKNSASSGKAPPAPPAPPQHVDMKHDIPQLVAASIGALLVGALYLAMPNKLTLGPSWLPLLAGGVLLTPALTIVFTTTNHRDHRVHRLIRQFTLILLAILTAMLLGSLALLIQNIANISWGPDLLKPAVLLWSCNVLVFGIWYWEMDGDGPEHRRRNEHVAADFQFPQQSGGKPEKGWFPGFIDYLFLAFCSATALSPADTMPLSRRAKLMMMSEAIISMVILVLLVSRSVNII
jgi:hypothetical protein